MAAQSTTAARADASHRSTQFTIGATGAVTNAIATGVDVDVAACVRTVISNIKFPKPKRGGSVTVGSPLILRYDP